MFYSKEKEGGGVKNSQSRVCRTDGNNVRTQLKLTPALDKKVEQDMSVISFLQSTPKNRALDETFPLLKGLSSKITISRFPPVSLSYLKQT